MDIIFIHDLRVDTVIGIYDWERKIRQTVIFDIEMETDCVLAASTDSVEQALNYKSVSKRVQVFVEESSFQLVETLAERTAALIISEFNVPWVRLRVNKKGALRGAVDVGVLIERRAS